MLALLTTLAAAPADHRLPRRRRVGDVHGPGPGRGGPPNRTVTASATVTSDTTDPDPGDNTATAGTRIIRGGGPAQGMGPGRP